MRTRKQRPHKYGREWPAEESEGSPVLMEDGAEPHAGRVTVDDERLVEDGHLENQPRGQGALQRLECGLGLL